MWHGAMGFGWIFWILAAATVIWLLANVLKTQRSGKDIRREKPLEILKERFARGEIDREEYNRRRKMLQE